MKVSVQGIAVMPAKAGIQSNSIFNLFFFSLFLLVATSPYGYRLLRLARRFQCALVPSLLPVLLLTACTQTAPSDFRLESEPLAVNKQHAAELNIELGLAYLEKGQVSRAKEKLNHAERLAPNGSMTHYALGYYWEKIGESDQADREYQKAIKLKAGGQEYNNYGAYLCRVKRYAEAEQQFLKAVLDAYYTEPAAAFENAGLCALQQGNLEKAKQYLEKAVRQDPSRSAVLSVLKR